MKVAAIHHAKIRIGSRRERASSEGPDLSRDDVARSGPSLSLVPGVNHSQDPNRVVGIASAILLAIVVLSNYSKAADVQPNADKPDYIPKLGEFPPPNTSGVYIAGELIAVDHVNRRGAIRLDGDFNDDHYHFFPAHHFAMLPYGSLRYHGAAAELRDIPIGTHVHGYFFRPLEGDLSIPIPKYGSKNTHAISLEDDFSFCQSHGQSWKILSIELTYDAGDKHYKSGDLRNSALSGKLKVVSIGTPVPDGPKGELTFDIDRSTRLWKGHASVDWEDIAPEKDWARQNNVATLTSIPDQGVQLNLTWAPEWRNHQFQCADLWLDEQARDRAIELQRREHIRHQHTRWLAGWIDRVEQEPSGGGFVTFTLFGGDEPTLYDDVRALSKPGSMGALAAAEYTLRSWWQNHDGKLAHVLEVKELSNPPPGSSGIQLRVKVYEMLEGYRPARVIRFRPSGWPANVKLPPEERIQNMDDRYKMQMGLDR